MDLGEKGNQQTDLVREEALAPFRRALEVKGQVKAKNNLFCSCGREIEKERREDGRDKCIRCASLQSQQSKKFFP